jgi:hypothetical protein
MNDSALIHPALIAAQAEKLAASDHAGAGFAILHEGQQALWLLLHWWLGGGVATHQMWQAPLGSQEEFQPVEPSVMACVWELGIIEFERKAWMATAMSGKPLSDYLALTLPRGTV